MSRPASDALWRWKQDMAKALNQFLVELRKQSLKIQQLRKAGDELVKLRSVAFALIEEAYDDEYDNKLLNPDAESIVDHVENAGVLPSELEYDLETIDAATQALIPQVEAKLADLKETEVPKDAFDLVMTPERQAIDDAYHKNPRKRRRA